MKKSLIITLGLFLVIGIFLTSLFVKYPEDKREPFGTFLTENKVMNTRILTKDHQGLEFEIVYEGKIPRILLEGYVHGTVRPIAFQKNMLEILKYNSLEHLKDSLKHYVTPMDSTFKIISIDTKYHLSPEVQELWDEYMAKKIEEAKAEERAKNLEILYGK
jgi:hypothetical protein